MITADTKIYKVQEYGLRFVKECIYTYRRETEDLGSITVTLPVEAENSLPYLRNQYDASVVKFTIGLLEIGLISIASNVPQP